MDVCEYLFKSQRCGRDVSDLDAALPERRVLREEERWLVTDDVDEDEDEIPLYEAAVEAISASRRSTFWLEDRSTVERFGRLVKEGVVL